MTNNMNRFLFLKMNRELWNMKLRALGSAALIIFSVALYIALGGMVPSAEEKLEEKVDDLKLNDYLVHVNQGNESMLSELEGLEGVDTAEARVQLSSRAFFTQDGKAQDEAASLYGIDPQSPPQINILDLEGSRSRYFSGNGSGEVLVEYNFAKRVYLGVNDTISVQTPKGQLELTIIGLVYTPEYIMLPVNPNSLLPYPGNLAVLFVPGDWLREAFELEEDFVNEFVFLFDEDVDQEALQKEINEKLADGVILYSIPRDEVYGYAMVKQDLEGSKGFTAVFAGLILMVAFFIVYVSFTRIVQEQRKEIGILRALGYSKRAVLGSYLYMAGVIGSGGSLAGILLGMPFARSLASFYVNMVIGSELDSFSLDWGSVFTGFLFGPVTACLASGIAAWSTVNMEPQDAIRGTPGSAVAARKRLLKRLRSRKDKTQKTWQNALSIGVPASFKRNYILHYTVRSMTRNKTRTILTTVAIAFSIAIGAFSILMMSSFNNAIEDSVDDYEKWDVIVEYSYPLNGSQAQALEPEGVTQSVLISRAQGSWLKGEDGDATLIAGLPWDQTLHLFKLEEGTLPTDSSQIMLNKGFAEANDLGPGDELTIIGSKSNQTLTVTAVVNDVLGEVFVNDITMIELTGEPLFSGSYLKVTPGSEEEVEEEFKTTGLVSEVQTRDNTKSGILDLMGDYQDLIYIFSLLGVGMAGITLVNTVFISVLERYAEYGHLRAIGYSRKNVAVSIISEILVIVAIGASVGVPLVWGMLKGSEPLYGEFFPLYETTLRLGDWVGYLFVLVLTVLVALGAAWPSIKYVNRMDIAKTVSGARFG